MASTQRCVRFDPEPVILAAATRKYPPQLRERLLALTAAQAAISLDELGALDVEVGECFADAATVLLSGQNVPAEAVAAIGSHGQTVRHRAAGRHPFSMQIGDAAVIAEQTGICTVADFRRADIAAGGQGAPLAPAFHAAAFASRRALRRAQSRRHCQPQPDFRRTALTLGFDTGPANCLLDAWIGRHQGAGVRPRRRLGAFRHASITNLLDALLEDPYFPAPPPKSSGREVLQPRLARCAISTSRTISAADVQATLLALTVRSIVDALRGCAPDVEELLVCGGGVHNRALMAALSAALSPTPVASTSSAGIDPDFVEAALVRLAGARAPGRASRQPAQRQRCARAARARRHPSGTALTCASFVPACRRPRRSGRIRPGEMLPWPREKPGSRSGSRPRAWSRCPGGRCR